MDGRRSSSRRPGCHGAPMALPHPGSRAGRREEPMLAANQRPIVALGVALALWTVTGCARRRTPVTGDLLATAHHPAGDQGFPAGSSAQAAGHNGDNPELDVEHPRVQTLVADYQTTMRPTLERALS